MQKGQELTSLFRFTLFTSLVPLLLFVLISIFEHALFNKNDEIHFFKILKSIISQGFSNLLSFSFMMIVLNAIYIILSSFISKKSSFFEDMSTLPSCQRKQNEMSIKQGLLTRKRSQKMLFITLSYGIIYFSSRFVASMIFGFFHYDSSQISPTSKTMDLFSFSTSTTRILEGELQENPEENFDFLVNQSDDSDIKTLSIGKTLSSLNINPTSIILSKSGKLAYVITKYYGGLKIIDISDHQYPTITGSLDLIKSDPQYKFKTLKLSADEKTLFASTTQCLEIVNVSNPHSPALLWFYQESAIPDINIPLYFIPTLALSQDETTLYVAGLGLQIFNVSKISRPKLLFSVQSPQVNNIFTVSSLALLPDGNTLAYANNSLLEFYHISDPTKPTLLNTHSAKISITSIALSKNPQTIFAVGFMENQEVMLEKINIQDPLSPQSIALYDLKSHSKSPPCIMGISPTETNIFVSQVSQNGSSGFIYFDMIGYDLLKKQTLAQSKSLLQNTMALTIIPQNNHVLVGSKERFQILEFSKNYPNTKAFCRFDANKNLSFPSVQLLESSEDNIWFAFSSSDHTLSSYNMTNEASPQELGSYQFPSGTFIQRMSLTKNRAFLQTNSDIIVLNSSQDITPLGSLFPKKPSPFELEDFIISNSKNIAYTIQASPLGHVKLSAINFTDFSAIVEVPFLETPMQYRSPQIALPKNRPDLLFVKLNLLQIFNISNPMAPVLITSQLVLESNDIQIFSYTFSQDAKVLFILILDVGSVYTLKIFDTSNLTNFKPIQTFDLPKILSETGRRPFILSNDTKKGFVITNVDLLILDLRNLTSPDVLGMIPLGLANGEVVKNFFLSPDETIGYAQTSSNRILKINLELTYTLYLPQENFLIGEKYSDSVMFLNSNKEADFLLMNPTDYKIIKLSLFDLQVNPFQNSPFTTFTPLPSWISFDSENQILTIESKRQRDLGAYTLYTISSKEIPLNAFEPVLNNSLPSEDMLTLLISLGYVDNQRFLTANFGLEKNFLLPSQYYNLKEKIYQTLQSYRIETFTDFNILPSLTLSTISSNGKFSISTPSNSSVELDIRLFDSKAQFLQKTYGTVLPLITENKNRLTIGGSLDHINKALQELVINLNGTEESTCQGEIIINDNLNPPISQFYQNISEYFFHNGLPAKNTSHNLTIQQQIDIVRLYTGQYFSINLDSHTFKDQYSDSLTYQLVQREEHQDDDSLPSWLTFQGLTLKGTPPEDIFQRHFRFGLIVKNEFKQIEIHMVLNIKISWQFIGKLFLRYSPYILTAIGLIVSANKIYNILVKKRYRHAKEFYLKIGEIINSTIIFPIRFIAEEKLEGDLILKNLKKDFSVDSETEFKQVIKEAINKMSAKDRQKLKLYSRENGQKRVYQYLQNELIMHQLNSSQEKATKNLFNSIKDKWIDFIEYDDSCGFTINESNLKALLEEKQTNNLSETLNDSPLLLKNDCLNIDLLKKALVVYATKNHELNCLHASVDILAHLQKPKNGIFRFFKQDLQRIKYSDKGILVYGLAFHIKENSLEIAGILDNSFEGNVLVIQIVNSHQRILKEIWIHGISNVTNSEEKSSYLSESQAKGKEYGVL